MNFPKQQNLINLLNDELLGKSLFFYFGPLYEPIFETSKNIPTRYLNAIRNSIYDYFGNDISIIYNFKNKTFHLVCYRGSPNIINFFNSFKNVKE